MDFPLSIPLSCAPILTVLIPANSFFLQAHHILDLEFLDNVKAHILQPDGTYVKQDKRGISLVNSQMEFCREAQEKAAQTKKTAKEKSRVFIPAEPVEDVEE